MEPIKKIVNGLTNLTVTPYAINEKKGKAFGAFLKALDSHQGLEEGLSPYLAGCFPGRAKLRSRIADNVDKAAKALIEELQKLLVTDIEADETLINFFIFSIKDLISAMKLEKC